MARHPGLVFPLWIGDNAAIFELSTYEVSGLVVTDRSKIPKKSRTPQAPSFIIVLPLLVAKFGLPSRSYPKAEHTSSA